LDSSLLIITHLQANGELTLQASGPHISKMVTVMELLKRRGIECVDIRVSKESTPVDGEIVEDVVGHSNIRVIRNVPVLSCRLSL
jgi:DNA-binding protein